MYTYVSTFVDPVNGRGKNQGGGTKHWSISPYKFNFKAATLTKSKVECLTSYNPKKSHSVNMQQYTRIQFIWITEFRKSTSWVFPYSQSSNKLSLVWSTSNAIQISPLCDYLIIFQPPEKSWGPAPDTSLETVTNKNSSNKANSTKLWASPYWYKLSAIRGSS